MLTAGRGSVATLLLTRPGRGTVAPRTMQEANLKPPSLPTCPSTRWTLSQRSHPAGSSAAPSAKPRVNAVPGV